MDTAGRTQIDDDLMSELEEVKEAVSPVETLLVVDAMTGQDAVNAAKEFHERIGVTGLVLSKLDGDARGGAALSIVSVTGVPIKFIATGEGVDALEEFHPDRLASRILGMGDMLTLIEKTQEAYDEEEAAALERKMRQATFDLNDFLDQLEQVRRMGGIGQILEMVPGMPGTEGEDAVRGPHGEAVEEDGGHRLFDDAAGEERDRRSSTGGGGGGSRRAAARRPAT